jgi:hypothetical protein
VLWEENVRSRANPWQRHTITIPKTHFKSEPKGLRGIDEDLGNHDLPQNNK